MSSFTPALASPVSPINRADDVAIAFNFCIPPVAGAPTPELKPAQRHLASLLTSENDAGLPTYPFIGISVPRRSGKTSIMLAAAVIRAIRVPGLRVGYCAQSGLKSMARWNDLTVALEKSGARGFHITRSNGSAKVVMENGSTIRPLVPNADAFRGEAYDLVILDESQEHSAEKATELLAALMPTMDTRPLAQLWIAGTAGKDRSSLLWQALERGRKGTWGIFECAAAPEADISDPAVWMATHPGLHDGLTTVERVRLNFETLTPEDFAAEYLGIWHRPEVVQAFSADAWQAVGRPHADMPKHFALSYDVSPDGARASLSAAYKADGATRVEVIDSRPGSAWLVDVVEALATKYRVPVGYDTASHSGLDIADRLSKIRPKIKLVNMGTAEVVTACQSFVAGVLSGELTHSNQQPLTSAAMNAHRRPVGDAGWAFGRRKSQVDITPLVSATLAARVLETNPVRSRPQIYAA